jgi:ribonuclease HI
MSKPTLLTINIDGASRGNPGPAAYAYVITGDSHPLIEEAGTLETATNNFAEYTALVRALERAAELGGERLIIRSDSELLVKQMNGLYRVKNEQLRRLYERARELQGRFHSVSLVHVVREENSHADRLCNEALNGLGAGATRSPAIPQGRGRQGESAREEALLCLRAAARSWSRGEPGAPTPEEVWDQLWSILEENGVLRAARPR